MFLDIKAILGKVAKGEPLSYEDKAALADYDPDKDANTKAAAARRDALKERDALKTRLAEMEAQLEEASQGGKSEVEKAQAQLAKLAKQVDDLTKTGTALAAEKRALVRGHKLDALMRGMKFVDGLDPDAPRVLLERAIAAVEDADLDNEEAIKPILARFTAENKALLLDTSGGGAGTPPKGGQSGSGYTNGKPLDQMTASER
jgi:hypothetical protein